MFHSLTIMTEEGVFAGSPEEDLIDRTWKKLKRDLRKEGFREGALKGQEETYQTGFDLGYAEGFRLGEVLGLYKGNSSILKHLNIEKSDVLEKFFDDNKEQRACILCKDENLKAKDMNNIYVDQKKINDVIISQFSFGR